jgi:FixJ family two-component response regulator
VFLTGGVDVPAAVQAMKGGAVDFLTKPPTATDLLEAVNRALKKDQAQRQTEADLAVDENKLALLTPREREVLEIIVKGHLNKEIAAELGMAERTTKFHRANIMEKLGVASIAALVQLATRLGISPSRERD